MGRRLALIIGNSQYDDRGLSQLVAPSSDVAALADVLRDPAVGAFDSVEALVNEGFARTLRAIAGFFEKRKRDDLLLLYFSGHGIRDEYGHLHLAVRDTERELLAATAVQSGFISGCMDRSASKRLVLVLDCCHSGAFGYGAKAAEGASVGTAVAFEGTGRGRVVLTATDSTQYAWEGDSAIGSAGPSVFTRHLTDGLKTGAADLNSDGVVTLDELYDYVYDQVVSDTSKQTPGKWVFGQQGEIVIAKRGTPAAPGALAGLTESATDQHTKGLIDRLAAAGEWLKRHPVPVAACAAIVLLGVLFLAQVRGRPPAPAQADVAPAAAPAAAAAVVPSPPPALDETPVPTAQNTVPSRGRGLEALPTVSSTPPASPSRLQSADKGVAATTTNPLRPVARAPAAVDPKVTAADTPAARERLDDRVAPRDPSPGAAERPATLPPAGAPAAAPAAAAALPAAAAPALAITPTPAAQPAAALVRKAIADYERAAEALDEAGVRRVWPTAPDALRTSYRNLTSQAVELDCAEPAMSGDTATVACVERIRSVGAGRIALPVATSNATFSLRRNGDAWEILRIARQPLR